MKTLLPTWGFALAAVLAPAALAAQAALPMGKLSEGTLTGGEVEYAFSATEPGFLLVVVRSSAGEDISLAFTDSEGQTLPEGTSDQDLNGDVGAEQLLVTIPRPGAYVVAVRCYDETASFRVGGSFLPSGLPAAPEDPDGRPSRAQELAVGVSHEDVIDPSAGDHVDWFRISVDKDGLLTVFTRVEGEGDLRLESYLEPEFGEPDRFSDEDRDGIMGNESLTLDVKAGQVVYIRVMHSFWGTATVPYRISSGVIEG